MACQPSIARDQQIFSVTTLESFGSSASTLYNILKSQLQTIENQTVPLNSVETEFSQMPDLLCEYDAHKSGKLFLFVFLYESRASVFLEELTL